MGVTFTWVILGGPAVLARLAGAKAGLSGWSRASTPNGSPCGNGRGVRVRCTLRFGAPGDEALASAPFLNDLGGERRGDTPLAGMPKVSNPPFFSEPLSGAR